MKDHFVERDVLVVASSGTIYNGMFKTPRMNDSAVQRVDCHSRSTAIDSTLNKTVDRRES